MSNSQQDSKESQLFLLSEYTLISEPTSKELLMVKKAPGSDAISGVRFDLTSFVKVEWQAEPQAVRISVEDPPICDVSIISTQFDIKASANSFLLNEGDGSLHLTGIGISDLITGNGGGLLEKLNGFASRQEKTHLDILLGKKELQGCYSFEIPEFFLRWDSGMNFSPFWDLRFRLIMGKTP